MRIGVQRLLAIEMVLGGTGVEILDDDAQFVDRPTDPLAVLLRKFRRLRKIVPPASPATMAMILAISPMIDASGYPPALTIRGRKGFCLRHNR